MYIRAFLVILLLLKVCDISALTKVSQDSLNVIVYYQCGSSNVSVVSANTDKINRFIQQLDSVRQSTLMTPVSLHVASSASPEGSLAINKTLVSKRNTSVLDYLRRHSETFRLMSDTLDCTLSELTSNHQYGKVARREYPLMRYSEVTLLVNTETRDNLYVMERPAQNESQNTDSVQVRTVDEVEEPCPALPVAELDSCVKVLRPVLFVKTNLLYDLLTFVNLSIEVPLSKRFTAEATIIHPWWHSTAKHKTIQMRYIAVTPRYYFKKSSTNYTSFFVGLTAGAGKYDLQWTRRGVQGTLWHISPTFGYSHHIAKRWKMEYSASVGFVQTRYCKYTQTADTPYGEIKVKDYPWVDKVLNTVLPTSLNVSLVYTFGKNVKIHRHGH